MLATPLVSVVIPAHNEERYLPHLLGSLRTQECGPGAYEAIVVADACTDHTVQVCSSFPVTVVLQITARNAAHARNAGAAHARGRLLCFLDADQRLEDRRFLPSLIHLASAPVGRLRVGTTAAVSRERSWRARVVIGARTALLRWRVLRVANGSVFVDAALFQALGGFRPRAVPFEQRDLLRRARRAGARFLYVGTTAVAISMRRYERAGYLATLGWWCVAAWRRLWRLPDAAYQPASSLDSETAVAGRSLPAAHDENRLSAGQRGIPEGSNVRKPHSG